MRAHARRSQRRHRVRRFSGRLPAAAPMIREVNPVRNFTAILPVSMVVNHITSSYFVNNTIHSVMARSAIDLRTKFRYVLFPHFAWTDHRHDYSWKNSKAFPHTNVCVLKL